MNATVRMLDEETDKIEIKEGGTKITDQ